MIYVEADDVIDVFFDRVYNTSESKVIAESKEDKIQVLMYDDNGWPHLLVTEDSQPVDSVGIDDVEDAEKVINRIYREYIEGNTPDEDFEGVRREIEIEERQTELENAALDFMCVVLETEYKYALREIGDSLPEIVDGFLEYLYKKQDIDPYRPMVLVDENGEEFYEEYPYAHMEFDDDTNQT